MRLIEQKQTWRLSGDNHFDDVLLGLMSQEKLEAIDPFDRPALAHVIAICKNSHSLSEAGRTLYVVSRQERKTKNDADRLKKYLAKFNLDWESVRQHL